MHDGLRADEIELLRRPPRGALARIATVGRDGMPLVVPVGWSFDAAATELVLGGVEVPATARWRHVERTGVAAVVIDGVAGDDQGRFLPWCITMRGEARAVLDERAIRFRPLRSLSFGLGDAHRSDSEP